MFKSEPRNRHDTALSAVVRTVIPFLSVTLTSFGRNSLKWLARLSTRSLFYPGRVIKTISSTRLVENPAGVKEPNGDPSSERVSLLAIITFVGIRSASKPLNKTAAQQALCFAKNFQRNFL